MSEATVLLTEPQQLPIKIYYNLTLLLSLNSEMKCFNIPCKTFGPCCIYEVKWARMKEPLGIYENALTLKAPSRIRGIMKETNCGVILINEPSRKQHKSSLSCVLTKYVLLRGMREPMMHPGAADDVDERVLFMQSGEVRSCCCCGLSSSRCTLCSSPCS